MKLENYRYLLISKVVNEKANKKRVAVHLNCSNRHINRLIKQFNPNNPQCFKHKNTGKIPINKTSPVIVKRILNLKSNKYKEFNI